MSSTDSPSTFYGNELVRALAEQSFGIKTFVALASTQLEALASVTLLEGQKISIKLAMNGYSIEFSDGSAQPSGEDGKFESLDELLRSASPMYERKRHEAWVQKLEKLV